MKDKKLFISIISIFTIISFIIGVSYAYFVPIIIGNETASTQNIKTGTLKINYTGTDTLDMNNTQPPDTKSMTFSVTNSGTLPVNNYQVYFSKVLNEILYDEMVYALTCQSSDENTCIGKEETPLPKQVGSALTQPSIAPGTIHTYTLSVTFKDTGSNQDYNQNKRVLFKITINEQQEFGTLIARQGWESTELFWEHRANITEVIFEDSVNIPNGVTSWDVSASKDSSVMAYIIDDGLGTNTYHLYIQSEGILNANPNSSYLFRDFTKLKTINNLSNFNTSNVTDMSSMFGNCSSLTSLDISNFNTINVTTMYYMFGYCSSLTNLDLSNFNTSSATNMQYMFSGCSSLASLDLSNFNTSSVTNMYAMFYGCSGLANLDLSNFNTISVTNMQHMFSGCSGLTNLNLRNATFTSVTSHTNMFYNITSGINIIVKDVDAQTFINARLSDEGKTGNVTIYVP